MISKCPQCKKDLDFTESQEKKIQAALDKLQIGQGIKFGCPHCKKPIEVKKERETGSKEDAFDVFPDLVIGPESKEETPPQKMQTSIGSKEGREIDSGDVPPPPGPPDISWIKTGEYGETTQSSEADAVLILMPDGESKSRIADAFQRLGYRIEYANNLGETMEKMVASRYPAIVMHTHFEGVPFEQSRVHNHMKWMPMPKRRYIYYVLIGPELQTLYNLEAFSLSANLVINEKDLDNIHLILRKGFHDHEKLFEPFLDSLEKHKNRQAN